ncbi:MAG TPA: 3-oxoacyl-ACP reductase family protein [Rickettsiales bacterium]|nr:3-oxoacyl-ACP reductase family protein [Rickettsiales bacterium]
MSKTLSGKTALVTGGSRGIGAAIVRRLARDGAQVAFTYGKSAAEAESLVKELTATGAKAKAYRADAADAKALSALVQNVLKDYSSIDILVNNAGVAEGGLIGEITLEQYNKVFSVNVEAVFALTNEVVPHLKSGSRIVNISSILGERAIMPAFGVYNASKFAVTGFTRSWAKDLGAKGILVNAVQPGPIATDMNPEDSDHADSQRAMTALGRYGRPEEIAAAVSFFAGPDASFITGATLNVDGGANA